jgi:hypothetical protein
MLILAQLFYSRNVIDVIIPTMPIEKNNNSPIQEPSVWSEIRRVARTGNPADIKRVKEMAKGRGVIPGLIAEIVLFNAEKFSR